MKSIIQKNKDRDKYKIPVKISENQTILVYPPIQEVRMDGWKRIVFTLSNNSTIKIPKREWEKIRSNNEIYNPKK